jgi:glutamate formiminotransferase
MAHSIENEPWIECVPNFSEGRIPARAEAIANAIANTPGVHLLGWESDADHNRSVVTFAGPPQAVLEGAVHGAIKAAELIDLNHHQGVHPRLGAADVIPFVPLQGATMQDCTEVAHRAAELLWQRANLPSYFYEFAAQPERKPLEKVRRKGFEQRLQELETYPPDTGGPTLHPTAGASCIGARGFLIAYNVELETPDVAIAQEVARAVRGSSGGFPFVKAMGVKLETRQQAQVSMNLVRFAEVPMDLLFERIQKEAAARGAAVADCELIGFVPQQAYNQAPAFFERCRNFTPSRIIEVRLAELLKR